MKIKILMISIALCNLNGFGQKLIEKPQIGVQSLIIKKQILADQLDNQAKDVPFAAVRIFVKTKLAAWLWKDGKDDTNRAEQLAVRAVEEFYDKKTEIGDADFLKKDLFALLETNAPEQAKKLRSKYAVTDAEDLSNAESLLDKEGGDKIVAAKIKKYLGEGKDLVAISYPMDILRDRKSPEFASILTEIINLEEAGRNYFTADSLNWVVYSFKSNLILNNLRGRFYKIVLNKARVALQNADASNITSADFLLDKILPDISANAPELMPEADGLKAVLTTRISQKQKEAQEANRRIEESADKLAATISEAEKTSDKVEKFSLLLRAQILAIKENNFQLAVDLAEKNIEDKTEEGFPALKFRFSFHDQRLGIIAIQALEKDDVEGARYALKKFISELLKADTLRRIALYFDKKKDTNAAIDAYDEALKLTVKADNDTTKFFNLLYLVSAAGQINQSRISEVTTIAAKSIDGLPTLNPEDKPETANYKNHVASIMAINNNLYRVISALARENKNEAANFASRINRREVRIVADLALAIDAVDSESKQTKAK